jgi:hypothetical protein
MTFFQALQAVNACNRIDTHAHEAQDSLLRTMQHVRDLKLGSKTDLAYDDLDTIERDMCNLYVRLGMIRSESANGGIAKAK